MVEVEDSFFPFFLGFTISIYNCTLIPFFTYFLSTEHCGSYFFIFYFTSLELADEKRDILYFSPPAEGVVSCIIRSLDGG